MLCSFAPLARLSATQCSNGTAVQLQLYGRTSLTSKLTEIRFVI
ncbi:hypothetical protein [Bacillus sp. 3255]|nr:hypothetical protein [Bacillus sp. 3255]